MANTIEVCGYSDDIVILSIYNGDNRVYEDEHKVENIFVINDEIRIHTSYVNSGWMLGISIVDEDIKLNDTYKIDLKQDHVCPYSPNLRIITDKPITVKGVYGDNEAKFREIASLFLGYDETDKLFKELKNNKLI